MLSLARLRLLQEFHRLGTITSVAESLNYSRSAVSQQLTLLEREVGVPLFEKIGRTLHLTEQGEILLAHATALLAAADQALVAVHSYDDAVSGTLRVTSFQSVLSTILPPALSSLNARYPELTVEVAQREVLDAMEELLAGQVDLVLGEEYQGQIPPLDPGIHREILLEDPMHLITPEDGPLAVDGIEELDRAPFAIDPPGVPTGDWAAAVCGRAGFVPRLAFATIDPLLQIHLVRLGHAVSFTPTLLAPMLEGVRVVDLPDNPTRTLYTAVRAGRQELPAIRAFRSALAAVARETIIDSGLVE
ncbi:LysR family transcriptional regulator [Corynebacterium pacaense]|uniref:LysR family transcriptional regulator n=1 Tax=Corynebacterium pacaense TaxID=1816684 RepID=UPI0009B96A23|nr:LysR family transcriptional regulator [Corynebacterium pacaense]